MSEELLFQAGVECRACGATGIFKGFAEADGFGVVCHDCEGTGRVTVKVLGSPFEGRRNRTDVVTVLRVNPGIEVQRISEGCLTRSGSKASHSPYSQRTDCTPVRRGGTSLQTTNSSPTGPSAESETSETARTSDKRPSAGEDLTVNTESSESPRICAWCRTSLGTGPSYAGLVSYPGNVSHGICPACAEKLEQQAREELEKR
jgi:hypothetical protein